MRKIPILRAVAVSVLTCLLFLSGCIEERSEKQSKAGAGKTVLNIGLIPEQNIFDQITRYEYLGDYLEKKTDTGIEFKILTRYGDIVTDFKELELDGAFFGSFIYALAHEKLGVIPLARPQYSDGSSAYHGLIFVREDSGISDAKDMKGKTFAFVDKATTAGYLLPLAYFKNNGITDYNSFFKKTYFTGTHENAIHDVLNRHADAGAAKNTVFKRLTNTDPGKASELRVIARSPDVPENALALRKEITENTRNRIKDALLNMHNDPEGKKALKAFGAARFIATVQSDYQSVYNYADKIGLDLKNYDYTND